MGNPIILHSKNICMNGLLWLLFGAEKPELGARGRTGAKTQVAVKKTSRHRRGSGEAWYVHGVPEEGGSGRATPDRCWVRGALLRVSLYVCPLTEVATKTGASQCVPIEKVVGGEWWGVGGTRKEKTQSPKHRWCFGVHAKAISALSGRKEKKLNYSHEKKNKEEKRRGGR